MIVLALVVEAFCTVSQELGVLGAVVYSLLIKLGGLVVVAQSVVRLAQAVLNAPIPLTL